MDWRVNVLNSNDELTTFNINRRYIRTIGVEIAFRSVDRGLYFSDEEKHIAYRHSAWRSGQMDLSAPSIYAKSLECLELHPGLKFLNIDSGAGYFSTVVGVLLGFQLIYSILFSLTKMGQRSSCFYNNNDELTTTLINKNFIRTKGVEIAFRSVDRGLYFSDEEKHIAYGYISNEFNLSAPSIYAHSLECLKLHPGHKFLNIRSGIGYFNTLAGVILGRNGVNHGVEMCSSLINYAYQKLEEFKLSAAAIDHYEFCQPVFIHGNVYDLLPTGYYDRVYCGAGVPRDKWDFVKLLIKVGGILDMPFNGTLEKVIRIGENVWKRKEVLRYMLYKVLVITEKCNTVKFPSVEPLSLKELCRFNIRSILRENLKQKCPNLAMRTKCQITSIPDIYDEDSSNSIIQIVRMQIEDLPTFNLQEIPEQSYLLTHVIQNRFIFNRDYSEDHLEPSVEVRDGNSIDARVERVEVQL